MKFLSQVPAFGHALSSTMCNFWDRYKVPGRREELPTLLLRPLLFSGPGAAIVSLSGCQEECRIFAQVHPFYPLPAPE